MLINTSDTVIGDCLDCSDNAVAEFTHLRDIKQMKSKIKMLNFRKVIFQFFRELVNKTLWKTALKYKVVKQSW